MTNVTLLTSRYWEGAYVLKRFLEFGIPCDSVLIQKTWWRENNSFEYSSRYLELRAKDCTSDDRRYFTIEELANPSKTKLHYINSINSASSKKLLADLDPKIIAVVGSKIIKKSVVEKFSDRIVNFHTGSLPEYRGPFSEFWAIYNYERDMVGTTIHMINSGIDTGPILSSQKIQIDDLADPQESHILNAKQGAGLMAKTIREYLEGSISPKQQEESRANYFSIPTEEQIQELELRLGRKIDLYFAD